MRSPERTPPLSRYLICFLIVAATAPARAQPIDSLCFRLYTDSLKKGQHNYINVDGRRPDGKWMPLTSKELHFHCDSAVFEGNELIVPPEFTPLKVTVTAVFRTDTTRRIERTIWIKQMPDGPLPTQEEWQRLQRGEKKGRKGHE
ncbi:MAG: hypothetical protein RJA57_208 [Bacteroidota bacterium]|jgi:hypothetical protein